MTTDASAVQNEHESTAALLAQIRRGDVSARERLFARYLPLLRRWAHGRLPGHARDLNDTQDLVQSTLLACLAKLDRFEDDREGALLAYLRTALLNTLRNELRRIDRHPPPQLLATGELDTVADNSPGRLDSEQWMDYERALGQLPALKREAVMLRLEFGMGYAEIAVATGSPSEGAAQMMVSRALVELAQAMR